MKKAILTFGLISGAISAAMMLIAMRISERIGFEKGEIVGYTTIVLSALLVFFGVRSYRENVGGGRLTFGRGFLVGILITLISNACYVGTWEFVNHRYYPDFADTYARHVVEKAKASGASQEKVEATAKQMEDFKRIYANPAANVAMTFVEVFPIGLLMTLLSAGLLRKKPG